MSIRCSRWLAGLVLFAALPFLAACPTCPEGDEFLEIWEISQTDLSTEDLFGISTTFEGAPHPEDTEYYLRFVSDSLMELVYERDGQVIVETYRVDAKEVERNVW